MQRNKWIFAALLSLILVPGLAMAEVVTGKLDRVSFAEGVIEVDGVVYKVNTESTRVSTHGAKLSEEDLRRGDDVVLHIDNAVDATGRPNLRAVEIIRGSKDGAES